MFTKHLNQSELTILLRIAVFIGLATYFDTEIKAILMAIAERIN